MAQCIVLGGLGYTDFTGDGVDDYGTEIPLLPQKNNVKDFADGVSTVHNVTLDGGSDISSYRLSIKSNNANSMQMLPLRSLMLVLMGHLI